MTNNACTYCGGHHTGLIDTVCPNAKTTKMNLPLVFVGSSFYANVNILASINNIQTNPKNIKAI